MPVLAGPALEWLRVRPGGVYVDCTAGAGGHSEAIARRLAGGRLIAIDRDPQAVAMTRERLQGFSGVEVVQANYGDLADVLNAHGLAKADGILIDAGVSSMQIDEAARGFSFQVEGPLDMRMDPGSGPSAAAYLAATGEEELTRVLKTYGDVRLAKRLAKAIVARRARGGIRSTGDLVATIQEALPFVTGVPEEVRTVFQAIRIAINDELRSLEAGLTQAIDALAPEGRLVVITFHSGEDRIAKNVLRDASRVRRELTPDGRVAATIPATLRLLTPKPVMADAEELRTNPRSHSAKLRAAERLAAA